MKNFFRIFAVVIVAVLMTSVAVFAEGEPTVTITNEVVDEDAGIYAFTVDATANPGIMTFSINFSYNSDVVVPYDANYLDGSFDVTDTENNLTEAYIENVYYKDTNAFCFDVASKLSLDVTLYEIDSNSNRTAVYPVFNTTKTLSAHKKGIIFSYYYTIADGKTLDDVKFALEGTDTVFENIKASDATGASVHVFAQDTANTYHYGSKGEIVVDAFFDKEEVTASTITVPAGSTVYFADGTTASYDAETEVEVPAEAGFIYVNNGYSTHAIYEVTEAGVPTKIEALDNAVVAIDGANIRTSGVQGIRTRAAVSNAAKALGLANSKYEIAEYGFIVTAETNKTGLASADYNLDMSLVDAGKAKIGVAYNKAENVDFVFSTNDETTIFTNVLKNIPLTKAALQANIVSRPYYIITDGENETVIYGEIIKKTVYGVASAIKVANGDDYNDNKAYIDSVIEAVEGAPVAELATEIAIDISKLYE